MIALLLMYSNLHYYFLNLINLRYVFIVPKLFDHNEVRSDTSHNRKYHRPFNLEETGRSKFNFHRGHFLGEQLQLRVRLGVNRDAILEIVAGGHNILGLGDDLVADDHDC